MAFYQQKELDTRALTICYQRKASEYLLRMHSLVKPDDKGSSILQSMGKAFISRLCTSVSPLIPDSGKHKIDSASRRLCLKSLTMSQDSMFNHFRNIPLTGIDGNMDDRSVDIDSYFQIRDHVDHLILHDDSCSQNLILDTVNSVCLSCGSPFLLYPMTEGAKTTVRLRRVKRGRTRQRRSMRYRKKQAIFDQQIMKHRAGGKQFVAVQPNQQMDDLDPSHSGLIAGVTAEKIANSKQHRMLKVRDGQSVQKVVYTCGACHNGICYKGVSAFKRRTRCIDRTVKSKSVEKSRDDSIKVSLKEIVSSKEIVPNRSKVLNSVVLTTKAPQNKRKNEFHANPKPLKKGKSALMDFLYSLND